MKIIQILTIYQTIPDTFQTVQIRHHLSLNNTPPRDKHIQGICNFITHQSSAPFCQ